MRVKNKMILGVSIEFSRIVLICVDYRQNDSQFRTLASQKPYVQKTLCAPLFFQGINEFKGEAVK